MEEWAPLVLTVRGLFKQVMNEFLRQILVNCRMPKKQAKLLSPLLSYAEHLRIRKAIFSGEPIKADLTMVKECCELMYSEGIGMDWDAVYNYLRVMNFLNAERLEIEVPEEGMR